MSVANKVIKTLSSVSDELYDLTLEAVFSRHLIDQDKLDSIHNIKKNICNVSNDLEKIYVLDRKLVDALDVIISDCVSSLHEIHTNLKQDLIRQNAEDDYAELSAQVVWLKGQIDRIKSS